MKKVFAFLLTLIMIMGLAACGTESEKILVSEPETLEGYWMAGDGGTISFLTDGTAIINKRIYDYAVYDKDKLSISSLGTADEFKFEINGDVLTLSDLHSNAVYIYYRDEATQEEIRDYQNYLAVEAAKQEQAQKEQEQSEKEQEEYNKYVNSLKSRMNYLETHILELEEWIADEREYIVEVNSEIEEVQQDNEMLDYQKEDEIDSLNEKIEICNQNIDGTRQEIEALQEEKSEIIAELTRLGEY